MRKFSNLVYTITACLVLTWAPFSQAANLVVTNASDDYPAPSGSLREAMDAANSNQESDTIRFAPGLKGQIIHLVRELPVLTEDGTTIDGMPSCSGDFDGDGDIDGLDLDALPGHIGDVSLPSFAAQFGRADCPVAPAIDGSTVWGITGIRIQNASSITINGLKLLGCQRGIILDGTVSHIIISKNEIVIPSKYRNEDRVTIAYDAGADVTEKLGLDIRFLNNRVENGRFGIYLNVYHYTARDIIMSGNTLTGSHSGISLDTAMGPYATVRNVTISDNTVNHVPDNFGILIIASHPWAAGGPAHHCTLENISVSENVVEQTKGLLVGIYSGTDNTISGLTIGGNFVIGSSHEGINIDNETEAMDNDTIGTLSDPAVIRNNIVVGSTFEGIQCDGGVVARVVNNLSGGNRVGLAFTGRSTARALNNVAYRNNVGVQLEGNTSVELRNNIIAENCTHGFRQMEFESAVLTLAYNDVWDNGMNYDGVSPGMMDISENPFFMNPEHGDFHLQHGSPCRNAGDPASAFNDLDGTRNDMGLFGGPNAAPVTFPVPAIDYPAGIEEIEILNTALESWVAVHFGGNYVLEITMMSCPCTVSSARVFSPSNVRYDLSDDGVTNGDMIAGDGQFENVSFFTNHPEQGPWRFELTTVDGAFFEKTLQVETNPLPYPVLFFPANESTITTLTPTLMWQAVAGANDGYSVGIFDGPPAGYSPEGMVYMADVDQGVLSESVPPGVLEAGKTYYWFIIAMSEEWQEDNGDYGKGAMTMWSFTTQ